MEVVIPGFRPHQVSMEMPYQLLQDQRVVYHFREAGPGLDLPSPAGQETQQIFPEVMAPRLSLGWAWEVPTLLRFLHANVQ